MDGVAPSISWGCLQVGPDGVTLRVLSDAKDAAQRGCRWLFVLCMIKFIVLSFRSFLFFLGDGLIRGVWFSLFSVSEGVGHFLRQGNNYYRAFICCVVGGCLLAQGFFGDIAAVGPAITVPELSHVFQGSGREELLRGQSIVRCEGKLAELYDVLLGLCQDLKSCLNEGALPQWIWLCDQYALCWQALSDRYLQKGACCVEIRDKQTFNRAVEDVKKKRSESLPKRGESLLSDLDALTSARELSEAAVEALEECVKNLKGHLEQFENEVRNEPLDETLRGDLLGRYEQSEAYIGACGMIEEGEKRVREWRENLKGTGLWKAALLCVSEGSDFDKICELVFPMATRL